MGVGAPPPLLPVVPAAVGRGVVSKESVRKHEARTMENEFGASGSCVEV